MKLKPTVKKNGRTKATTKATTTKNNSVFWGLLPGKPLDFLQGHLTEGHLFLTRKNQGMAKLPFSLAPPFNGQLAFLYKRRLGRDEKIPLQNKIAFPSLFFHPHILTSCHQVTTHSYL